MSYKQAYGCVLLISNSTSQPSDLTEATVSQFRKLRVRTGSRLLLPGQQCRVCLRPYVEGDIVRYLPCLHHFHLACIDQWLLHQHPTCPVDAIVYTNESVKLLHKAQQQRSVHYGCQIANFVPHQFITVVMFVYVIHRLLLLSAVATTTVFF